MMRLAAIADSVLRASPWPGAPRHARAALGWLLALVFIFGMAYGAAMGTFGGVSGGRLLQVVYSAVKVPLLLLVTGALSLPCFFVLYSLFGLREDFGAAVRALLAAQAGLAVILASLAPLTLLWYVSFADYTAAVLFNGGMFATASFSAQYLVRQYYQPLIDRDARHRLLLRAWLVIYIFVGIQMGWVLRPFVGNPDEPVQFFRAGAWGNAYVVVCRLAWNALAR